jgi:hypothetical protein
MLVLLLLQKGRAISVVFFFFSFLGWGETVQPRMRDYKCGAVGGKRMGRGNRNTGRKPAPVSFCPPYIPHDMTWARTRAAAVGSSWLTAWAMARYLSYLCNRPWRPIGLWDVEVPTFSRQLTHRWRWCQPYAPAALYLQEDSWYSFLLEARATVRLQELGQLENSINRTGIEPSTFQLVAQCLNQLRYLFPPTHIRYFTQICPVVLTLNILSIYLHFRCCPTNSCLMHFSDSLIGISIFHSYFFFHFSLYSFGGPHRSCSCLYTEMHSVVTWESLIGNNLLFQLWNFRLYPHSWIP